MIVCNHDPSSMFSECESGPPTLSEEFTKALRLLHSSDAGSAEELRCLLVATIARRYGSERTSLIRLAKANRTEEVSGSGDSRQTRSTVLDLFTDCPPNNDVDKDEVPRISIPDEGPSDEALCKVCNVSEFGPLILLQCQECKELYHPLCHQPQVIDLDIHNPDFLWQCSDCQRKTWPQGSSIRGEFFDNSSWIPGGKRKQISKKSVKQKFT